MLKATFFKHPSRCGINHTTRGVHTVITGGFKGQINQLMGTSLEVELTDAVLARVESANLSAGAP